MHAHLIDMSYTDISHNNNNTILTNTINDTDDREFETNLRKGRPTLPNKSPNQFTDGGGCNRRTMADS